MELKIINLNGFKIATSHFENLERQLECMGPRLALKGLPEHLCPPPTVTEARPRHCGSPRCSPGLRQWPVLVHLSSAEGQAALSLSAASILDTLCSSVSLLVIVYHSLATQRRGQSCSSGTRKKGGGGREVPWNNELSIPNCKSK